MNNRYRYLFIILLFILVGLLHVYPDLRFIHELGKDFQGIHLMGAGDENVYLSRIAGVIYKGDMRLSNVGVYGHQNDPLMLPPLPEVTEGMIGKWLRLEIWQTDILATFLFPIVIFYLIYFLVYNLSSSFKFSILAALGVVINYYWFTPNLKAILSLSTDYFTNALFFTRPISPQFNFMPFILSLYLIYKFSVRKDYYLAVLTGLVIGLLFYTSFFFWSFVLSGLGFLMMIDLFRTSSRNVKKFFVVFVIAVLVGVPYWISFHSLSRASDFKEILGRCGVVCTRKPIIPIVDTFFLVSLIILLRIFQNRKEKFYYMISFVLAGIACLNQQVITGTTMQPVHWQFFTNKIFIMISIFACLSFINNEMSKTKYGIRFFNPLTKNLFFYGAVFVSFGLGFIQQNLYYTERNGAFRRLQAMGPVIRYIQKETPVNSVILTNPFNFDEERLISVFTKNYPYISSSFFMTSTMTLKEIEERFLFGLNFFGYTPEEAEGLFRYMNGGLFRGMQVHPLYGGTREKNEAYINKLKNDYAKLVKSDPITTLKKYKVDYVLLAKYKEERLLSNTKTTDTLELEYADRRYSLYKLKK